MIDTHEACLHEMPRRKLYECGIKQCPQTPKPPTSGSPPVLILDGGLGTALEQKYHVAFSVAKPLWSADLLVSDPDTLLACQSDFGRGVPVDVLLTATYQVSVAGFARTKTAEFPLGIGRAQIPDYVDAAVRIAARATGRDAEAAAAAAAVALSIGPYGACMIPSQEYSGAYDEPHGSRAALYEWHLERMRLFAASPRLVVAGRLPCPRDYSARR